MTVPQHLPIGLGGQTVLPYLLLRDTTAALAFYERAFGAVRRVCLTLPDGRVAHAEIVLSGNQVWMADEAPELACPGPQTLGGAGVMQFVYVDDVDALVARAVKEGATVLRPCADQFWGVRVATLQDPFGHGWTFATRLEAIDLPTATARAAREGLTAQAPL